MSDFEDPLPTVNQDFPAPSQSPSSSVRKPRSGRRLRLGIIGFPNSGKTSWLYSLVNGSTPHVRGQRPWGRCDHDPAFSAMVGSESGSVQQATSAGVFRESRFCRMIRPWVPFLPPIEVLSSSYWINIPEVAGETVRRIALGQLSAPHQTGSESTADQYLGFLADSDAVLCLVGADSQDLSEDFIQLRQVLPSRKSRGDTLPVTVLLTKIDRLRQNEARDIVILPREESVVATLLSKGRRPDLEEFLLRAGSDDVTVKFSVNALIACAFSRGDLELHEALAVDFIKHDNPIAAQRLESLAMTRGIDLRFYVCAPYGREFTNADGSSIFPPIDQMRPLMVYEPLEDLLERSWRRRAGRRLRRWSTFAAAIALGLTVVGPGSAWWLGRRFDQSIQAGRDASTVKADLDRLENWPYCWVERTFLEHARLRQGERWLAYRDLLIRNGDGLQDPRVVEAEDEAMKAGLDRDTPVLSSVDAWQRLGDSRSARDMEAMERHILKGEPAPSSPELNSTDTRRLSLALDQQAVKPRVPSLENAAMLQRLRSLDPGSIDADEHQAALQLAMEKLKSRLEVEGRTSNGRIPEGPRSVLIALVDLGLKSDAMNETRRADATIVAQLETELRQMFLGGSAINFQPGFFRLKGVGVEAEWLEVVRDRVGEQLMNEWWSRVSESFSTPLREEMDADTRRREIERAVRDVEKVETELIAMQDAGLPSPEAGGACIRSARSIRLRQRSLDAARNATAIEGDVMAQLRDAFLGDSASISFEPLEGIFGEQLAILQLELQKRYREAESDRDLDLANRMRELLVKVSSGDEEILGAEDQDYLLLLREIRKSHPDQEFVEVILEKSLDDPGWFQNRGSGVEDELVESSGAPFLIATFAKASSALSDRERRAFLERLLQRLPEDVWSRADAVDCEAFLASSIAAGVNVQSVGRRLLSPWVQKVKAAGPLQNLDEPLDRIAGLLRVMQGSAGSSDVVQLGCEEALTSDRELWAEAVPIAQMRAKIEESSAARMRQGLIDRDLGTPWLEALEGGIRHHLERIETWGLVPVAVGAADGGFLWVAPREWSDVEILRLAGESPSGFRKFVGSIPSFRFDERGTLKPTQSSYRFSPAHLGLTSHNQASELVGMAGLRLPTTNEWLSLRNGVPQSVKPPSDLALDASGEALAKFGDETREGLVGLGWGVREWVSDAQEPQGASNMYKDRIKAADKPPTNDVGLRPVLDLLPETYR